MSCFRTVLQTMSGLYRDLSNEEDHSSDELLRLLPDDILEQPAALQRLAEGEYLVELDDGRRYALRSRRRSPRPPQIVPK